MLVYQRVNPIQITISNRHSSPHVLAPPGHLSRCLGSTTGDCGLGVFDGAWLGAAGEMAPPGVGILGD